MTEYVEYWGDKYIIEYSSSKSSSGGQWYVSFGLFTVKLKVLLLICAAIVGTVFALNVLNSNTQKTPESECIVAERRVQQDLDIVGTTSNHVNSFLECGLVFPDSNERYLTDQDIDGLREVPGFTERELLRYAVNELYARHYYKFHTKEYTDHYCKYGFFGYLDAEAAVSQFNEYEQANLTFLCNIEKARGYR